MFGWFKKIKALELEVESLKEENKRLKDDSIILKRKYDKKGYLSYECFYKQGKKEGFEVKTKDGVVTSVIRYENGEKSNVQDVCIFNIDSLESLLQFCRNNGAFTEENKKWFQKPNCNGEDITGKGVHINKTHYGFVEYFLDIPDRAVYYRDDKGYDMTKLHGIWSIRQKSFCEL